jgi:hypothetical protein
MLVKPTTWAAASPSGVLALPLAQLVHALDLERGHRLRDLVVHLAAQPDEVGVGLQAFLQIGLRHLEQAGQLTHLLGRGFQVFGNGPQRRRGHAGGQQLAIAIEDATTVGLQLDAAFVAVGTLLLEEVVVDDLDPGSTSDEHGKAQADGADEELHAPHGRARSQQRAGRVAHGGHGRRTLLARATEHATPQIGQAAHGATSCTLAGEDDRT